MPRNSIRKKGITFAISALLILLIFLTCIQPATAVHLYPGEPDETSVTENTKITFEDVTLTIRGSEKIPISSLKFTIFDYTNDQELFFHKLTSSKNL